MKTVLKIYLRNHIRKSDKKKKIREESEESDSYVTEIRRRRLNKQKKE